MQDTNNKRSGNQIKKNFPGIDTDYGEVKLLQLKVIQITQV